MLYEEIKEMHSNEVIENIDSSQRSLKALYTRSQILKWILSQAASAEIEAQLVYVTPSLSY